MPFFFFFFYEILSLKGNKICGNRQEKEKTKARTKRRRPKTLPVTAAPDLVSVGNEASKGIADALMRSAGLGTTS